MQSNWWKEGVVYQIYPRSFKDSNNDGIGDLNGIIEKIDYLKNLGIDIIWLSPHFKSPNADMGYDISDYQDIMEEFGTLEDFKVLLDKAHQNNIKLIIDLVVNHSSDEHFWFKEAKKSKDNPYHDYYIWKDKIPNDWISFFSGPAWTFNPETEEYYLHLFLNKQPDLNWENPKLRAEVYKMMKFWLDMGVDGFRMDVISLISKDQEFKNFPEGRFGDLSYYANGPKVHQYLQEMNSEVLSKYDCMTVGEGFGVASHQANLYTGKSRNELNSIYHFDHCIPRNESNFLKPEPEFSLNEIRQIFNEWNSAVDGEGWNSVYWGNHDNPRILSRFGDVKKYWYESATMLAAVLLTQNGTPYIYQGDEIGMTNCDFNDISEYRDVQVINAFKALTFEKPELEPQFMQAANKIARDHARTPFQWNAKPNAGFTDAQETWLKVNPNFTEVNFESQAENPNSVFNTYKKLLKIRKENKALIYGSFKDLNLENNEVYSYIRKLDETEILVFANFTKQVQSYENPTNEFELIFCNYSNSTAVLNPYEARIYRKK